MAATAGLGDALLCGKPVVAGTLGVAAQLIYLGMAEAATSPVHIVPGAIAFTRIFLSE